MTTIVNHHNLPELIVRAARSDKYSRGDADISVTSLIDAPQVAGLWEKHKDEIETDVVDRVWALLGTGVHALLQHANLSDITEERLFAECNGWVVSGGIDVQRIGEGVEILDYKVTRCWSVILGKDSWEKQLNCYSWLVRRTKGLPTTGMKIIAFLRDWDAKAGLRDPRYPKAPVVGVEIPIWTDSQQDAYVRGRVLLHQLYRSGIGIPCTKDEMWERDGKWAVTKDGKKRAVKLFDAEKEALDFSSANGYGMIYREGPRTRCEGNYCGVSKFCSQYKTHAEGREKGEKAGGDEGNS